MCIPPAGGVTLVWGGGGSELGSHRTYFASFVPNLLHNSMFGQHPLLEKYTKLTGRTSVRKACCQSVSCRGAEAFAYGLLLLLQVNIISSPEDETAFPRHPLAVCIRTQALILFSGVGTSESSAPGFASQRKVCWTIIYEPPCIKQHLKRCLV